MAAATAVPAAESSTGESAHHADDARLRALLHRLTTVDGAPGALAEVRDRRRSTGADQRCRGPRQPRAGAPRQQVPDRQHDQDVHRDDDGRPLLGHTGDFLGYETAAGATVDGRQATVMVNLGPGKPDAQSDDIQAAIETALSR